MIDLSRVDKMFCNNPAVDGLQLANGLHVACKRYQYCNYYFAALTFHSEPAVLLTYTDDTHYEDILRRLSWFPYREGKTSQDALASLMDFLNTKLTKDRDHLINWAGQCATLETFLAEGTQYGYPVPGDWNPLDETGAPKNHQPLTKEFKMSYAFPLDNLSPLTITGCEAGAIVDDMYNEVDKLLATLAEPVTKWSLQWHLLVAELPVKALLSASPGRVTQICSQLKDILKDSPWNEIAATVRLRYLIKAISKAPTDWAKHKDEIATILQAIAMAAYADEPETMPENTIAFTLAVFDAWGIPHEDMLPWHSSILSNQ